MLITRITTKKHPDMIVCKVILDTGRLRRRAKDIYKRIEEVNEVMDRKIDRTARRICDILG
jgi:hypothetical protein